MIRKVDIRLFDNEAREVEGHEYIMAVHHGYVRLFMSEEEYEEASADMASGFLSPYYFGKHTHEIPEVSRFMCADEGWLLRVGDDEAVSSSENTAQLSSRCEYELTMPGPKSLVVALLFEFLRY